MRRADVCAPALFLCYGGINMSAVTLLCADHSLPLYCSGSRRIRSTPAGPVTEDGFSVQTHQYYRRGVEELGLTMKPFQYELDLRATEEDADQLRAYLTKYLRPGETAELWNLWVGDGPARAFHFTGPLAALEPDTLEQLFEREQTCLTIKI